MAFLRVKNAFSLTWVQIFTQKPDDGLKSHLISGKVVGIFLIWTSIEVICPPLPGGQNLIKNLWQNIFKKCIEPKLYMNDHWLVPYKVGILVG